MRSKLCFQKDHPHCNGNANLVEECTCSCHLPRTLNQSRANPTFTREGVIQMLRSLPVVEVECLDCNRFDGRGYVSEEAIQNLIRTLEEL